MPALESVWQSISVSIMVAVAQVAVTHIRYGRFAFYMSIWYATKPQTICQDDGYDAKYWAGVAHKRCLSCMYDFGLSESENGFGRNVIVAVVSWILARCCGA